MLELIGTWRQPSSSRRQHGRVHASGFSQTWNFCKVGYRVASSYLNDLPLRGLNLTVIDSRLKHIRNTCMREVIRNPELLKNNFRIVALIACRQTVEVFSL